MHLLSAFIPTDRRLALSSGHELPDRCRGAVLFADISGFTPLTAALAGELGVQRGAEEVLNQINPVYEALIAQLERYGGSVIGFAGDSITCWLNDDDGRLATACALAMQEAMRPFSTVHTPAGTPITLAIKVAVAAGPARRFVVGDPAIQRIDVLAGRTLDQVAAAERMAERGEVVVDEPTFAACRGHVAVDEWRMDEQTGAQFAVINGLTAPIPAGELPPPVDDVLDEAELRPFVLPPVYRRLKSGAKFLAELRPAVAMFLKFGGIDYDDDNSAGQKLDAYIRWLQKVLARHEGYLIQLTIGDKGSYVYASFGAPLAHDDDDERAIAAADELRHPPPDLATIIDIRIGISRGRVWAGQCGAQSRHTYGVMGNEVNMAARLMSKAAPGQVLVRRRIADATSHAYEFRHLGLITVKGSAEPIPIAELVGVSGEANRQKTEFAHPLVGREPELAELEVLLDQTLAGRGQVVSLVGAGGIGKSHLLFTLRNRATGNGFLVATGLCQRIMQSSAYYPWQPIIRQVLGLNATDPSETAAATLTQAMMTINPDWQLRLPLLGDLLGLPISDNPTTGALEPRRRQEALLALVGEVLRTLARSQPLVLIIDNAHWMDDASATLASALMRSLGDAPILLLLSARPDAAAAEPQATQQPNTHRLGLGELGTQETIQVAESLLDAPLAPLARAVIAAKAHGNPFFVRELVGSLRESGRLISRRGRWDLSDEIIGSLRSANILMQTGQEWAPLPQADLSAISLGVPDSIHGVVLARIDNLPETHKPLLKVASVIGQTFDLAVTEQLHPLRLPQDEVAAQAALLQDRELIMSVDADRQYAFRQQTIQEVAYETLLYTQRRELHGRLAAILEQSHPDGVEAIAYHAYAGEDWPRALTYQLLAGQRARQLFANLGAIDHFRKALISSTSLAGTQSRDHERQIHASLGELLVDTGQYDQAIDHLQIALAMARELGEPDEEAQACRWIARAHELRGQYQPALDWIGRGLAALGKRTTPAGLDMQLIMGLIYTRQGEYQMAATKAAESLLAAAELGDASISARAHNLLGIIDRLGGKLGPAVDHFEQALALYRDIGNLQGQALVLNQMATALFDAGQWTEAADSYQQAGSIFSRLGDAYNALLVDNNLGGIALGQGRLDDALALYNRAIAAQEQLGGSLYLRGALHLNLGATYVRRGERAAALEQLQESRDLFEQGQVRDLLPEMHRHLAEAHLLDGDMDRAEQEATTALQLARNLAMPVEEGHALRVLAGIHLRRGRADAAESSLLMAIDHLEAAGDEYGIARARLLLAQLCLQRQHAAQCLEQLDRAEPPLARLGATIELQAVVELREQLSRRQPGTRNTSRPHAG